MLVPWLSAIFLILIYECLISLLKFKYIFNGCKYMLHIYNIFRVMRGRLTFPHRLEELRNLVSCEVSAIGSLKKILNSLRAVLLYDGYLMVIAFLSTVFVS